MGFLEALGLYILAAAIVAGLGTLVHDLLVWFIERRRWRP